MRKLLTWLLVTLGIAALIRRLRRGKSEPASVEPPTADQAADPADELRRKLDESRAPEPVAEAPAEPEAVDERRADVHEQGRAAVDEMRDSTDS